MLSALFACLGLTPQQSQLRRDWKSAFATQPSEFANVAATVISGRLPASLRGTLYKNGPARFERGGTTYAHWLDGDGYLTALTLSDAGAEWSGRYIATDIYKREDETDEIQMRTTFGTQKPGGIFANVMDIKLKSPANTNVLAVDPSGPLLALWEAGPPYEIDRVSLKCTGPSDLGGRLRLSAGHGALPGTTGLEPVDRFLESVGLLTDACSAHPREDAHDRKSTVAWSWRQRLVGDPAIEVALHNLPHGHDPTATPSGSMAASAAAPVRSTLQGAAFAPHDMALSSQFALFVASPTRVDILPFIAGLIGPAQCTVFDEARTLAADGTSHIHLVDRTGGGGANSDAIKVAIGAPYHPVHCANAWDDAAGSGAGGTVTLLASCWPPEAVRRLARSGSSLLGSWEDLRDGDFSDVPMTNLCRFVVDVASRTVVEHTILAGGCQLDHPKAHPRWAAEESRIVFGTLGRRDNGGVEDVTPAPPQSFGCVDVAADGGRGLLIDSWHAGERRLVDEATLVPMADAEGDERAVWLVAPIFDGESRQTSYVVLDGRRLADGPVCELALPNGIFIPWALHGTWVDSRYR